MALQQANRVADKARLRRWAAAGAILVLGCVPETEGVADLLDGAHSYVEFPGRRVLAGRFSTFGLDRSDAGMVALGLREGRLVIAPFEGGAECDAGPAASVATAQFYGLRANRAEPRVPFLETRDANGRGPLKFTDHRCNVVPIEPVPSAGLPLNERVSNAPRYLVLGENLEPPLSAFRQLYACSPWTADVECFPIGDTKRIDVTDGTTWSLELDATRVETLGEQATKLVLRGEDLGWTEMAYEVSELVVERSEEDIAFIDPKGLHVVDKSSTGFPEQIEPDACALHASRGLLHSTVFSYRAPCDSGPLVIYDAEAKERFELAGAGELPVLSTPDRFDDRIAFYLSDTTEIPAPVANDRFRYYSSETAVPYVTGTLWAERLGSGLPVRGPERALLASVVWTGNEAVAIADFDGTVGRYVLWNVDNGEIHEIANGVTDFGFGWAISDFDGTAGTLRQVFPDFTSTVLAHGVPNAGSQPPFQGSCLVVGCSSSLVSESVKWAVLSEYDGETGTLLLFTRPADSLSYGPPEVIERNVRPDGYRLLYDGDAVLYLTDYSSSTGTGKLNVRFVRTADTFSVPNVDRFYETSSPDPAIVYSVPDGPNAGVWYARLR